MQVSTAQNTTLCPSRGELMSIALGCSLCFILSSLGGCADVGPQPPPPRMIMTYPSYVGSIEVENRSQFPYTELYLHAEASPPPESLNNLLTEPLAPGAVVSVEVVATQFITALRPRVEGGPLWRVKSDRPVTFYHSEAVPEPRLWIIDQGFIVIDALSSSE